MTDRCEIVANRIRAAFAGVKLGPGIGLLQGQGLDDYADDSTLNEYRSQDESDDWTRIDIEKLNIYFDSLSYMDEEGMRFHLPAYVLADLQGGLFQDLLFHLCFVSKNTQSRFDLLNTEQRDAIREFLLLRSSDLDYSVQVPMIRKALEQYWA